MEKKTNDRNKILVAIDLGSANVIAVAAEEQPDSRLKVLAEERKETNDGIRYGMVQKQSSVGYVITESLKCLKNRINVPEILSAFVAVGGRSMQMVEMTAKRDLGPNRLVSAKVLEEMQQECKEKFQRQNAQMRVYDVIPQYFLLDGKEEKEYADPLDMKAKTLQGFYMALVGLSAISENTKRCFDQTPGIVIENTDGMLKLDAVSTALLSEEERQIGSAIIDFGAETTTLSIYKNSQLQQMCVVPLGGAHLTKDIQSLGISVANAEKLKCLKGQAMECCVEHPVAINIPSLNPEEPKVRISTKFLAQIIEARLSEITAKIFTVLQPYESELEGSLYLTGGGAKLENIVDFVQAHTGMEVLIGSHAEWLTDDTSEIFMDPEYSQVIGTLALGAQYRKENADRELPESKVKKNQKKNRGDWFMKLFTDDEIM